MAEPRPERPEEAGNKYTYIRPILETDIDDTRAEQGFFRMWNRTGYRIGTVFETVNEMPGQVYAGLITRMGPTPESNFVVVPVKFLNTHFTQNETSNSGRSSLGGRRRKSTRRKSYRKYRKHYSRKYKK